ncbi:TPA: G5 domain-containing protein [Streptococcus suis]|uniref:G5 domain-containing protein n=1 Tax=Streptococcus suis TaxID=1307 RepID=UPI0004105CB8|nr:G5 domain-containing protein [Streptococcus suis]MCE6985384.1 G5 domain-containing protein [Streptococcus suis]HEM3231913.1 G5 domain-containing protein [Streptococcus suis 2726]HEM3548187.1 G5 domain-containing protein [Streptococcus suis]HEM3559022.1 G5 domain-containing protein [Streptococcus suis]HEM4075432.1 G5 domain-containing protein [Streptococcus suis]
MKKRRYQSLVGLVLVASLVNPLPWFENVELFGSITVSANDLPPGETPPGEDEEIPDATKLKAIKDFTALNDELKDLIENDGEEAKYLVEENAEQVNRWKDYLAKTAEGKAQAARWDALVAQLNGGTTQPAPSPTVTTRKEVIPITTVYTADPSVEANKQTQVFAGVAGVKTYTTTNGVEDAGVVTIPMEPRKVTVGTKPKVATETVPSPKDIEEKDPTLEEGKRELKTPAVLGTKTTTTTYTLNTTTGVATANEPTVKITEGTAAVYRIGTKKPVVPVVTTEEVSETKSVPFETIRENDPNLEAGKEVVATEGKNGVRTIVYTVTKKDGTETGRVVKSDTITTPAVNKVIKVGTKKTAAPVVTTEEISETKPVPFETIREEDPNLEAGKEVVAIEGKEGVRTIVYIVTKTDGVETSRVVKSDIITTPAVNKVIKVGTKTTTSPVVTTEEVSETKSVPFETIRENDPNLEAGKEVVATEGKEGVRTIVYTVTKTDGVETSRVVKSDSVTTPAVNKVIKVGTKTTTSPVVTTEEISETKPVPFETIRENDPNLEAGKEVVAAEGKEGVRTIVYTVTKIDGVETGRVVKSDTLTIPAVNKVIKVGTKRSVATPVATAKENKSKTENKNKTKVVDGKVLPETSEQSSGLAVIGLTLLAGLLTFIKNKRKKS